MSKEIIIHLQNDDLKAKLFKYLDENGYSIQDRRYSMYSFPYNSEEMYIRIKTINKGSFGTLYNKMYPEKDLITATEFLIEKGALYKDESRIKKLLRLNKLPSEFTSDQSKILKENNIEL